SKTRLQRRSVRDQWKQGIGAFAFAPTSAAWGKLSACSIAALEVRCAGYGHHLADDFQRSAATATVDATARPGAGAAAPAVAPGPRMDDFCLGAAGVAWPQRTDESRSHARKHVQHQRRRDSRGRPKTR